MEKRFQYLNQTCVVRSDAKGSYSVALENEEPRHVDVKSHGSNKTASTDQASRPGQAVRHENQVWVRYMGRTYVLELQTGGGRRTRKKPGGDLSSPMPGQVVKHLASIGDEVEAGEPLLVVEAMKMQLEIAAPHSGKLTEFTAAEGEQIEAGVPLAMVEPSS